MRRILLGALWIAGSYALCQETNPSPNEAPTGQHPEVEHSHEASGVSQASEHARAAVEHGEAEAEHEMPNEIWWKWANFAILFGGLGYLIGKNAGPFFKNRTASIQKGITEAAQLKADAEARAYAIEKRISNLSAEVGLMRQRARGEGAAESARLQQESAAQMGKIQAQAEAEIASAAKRASLDLKAYSAQLAISLAEQQVQSRMNSELQHRLADGFVQDLHATNDRPSSDSGAVH